MKSDDFSRLLNSHRSIRSFDARPVEPALVDHVLHEALQGSSSSGNLNLVSVIKTFDVERKAQLCKLHFDQPMVRQAACVLTFLRRYFSDAAVVGSTRCKGGVRRLHKLARGVIRCHHPRTDYGAGAGVKRTRHLLHGHDAALNARNRGLSGVP